MAEVVVPKVEVVPCLPSFQVVLPFQVGVAVPFHSCLPFQVGEVVLPFQVVVGEVVQVELVGEVAVVGFQEELVRGGGS